jgi:hypothetical protein
MHLALSSAPVASSRAGNLSHKINGKVLDFSLHCRCARRCSVRTVDATGCALALQYRLCVLSLCVLSLCACCAHAVVRILCIHCVFVCLLCTRCAIYALAGYSHSVCRCVLAVCRCVVLAVCTGFLCDRSVCTRWMCSLCVLAVTVCTRCVYLLCVRCVYLLCVHAASVRVYSLGLLAGTVLAT